MLINDAKSVRTTLQALQEMGVAFALDDFGTGYSSLSYLSRFGFNELKIDRSFVSKMAIDPRALSIVQTVVLLARHLDMRTVGEGVETREQARLLHGLGCARGQGYLSGRPEPIDVLLAHLSDRETLRSVA